jgi:hypothetical protein
MRRCAVLLALLAAAWAPLAFPRAAYACPS